MKITFEDAGIESDEGLKLLIVEFEGFHEGVKTPLVLSAVLRPDPLEVAGALEAVAAAMRRKMELKGPAERAEDEYAAMRIAAL